MRGAIGGEHREDSPVPRLIPARPAQYTIHSPSCFEDRGLLEATPHPGAPTSVPLWRSLRWRRGRGGEGGEGGEEEAAALEIARLIDDVDHLREEADRQNVARVAAKAHLLSTKERMTASTIFSHSHPRPVPTKTFDVAPGLCFSSPPSYLSYLAVYPASTTTKNTVPPSYHRTASLLSVARSHFSSSQEKVKRATCLLPQILAVSFNLTTTLVFQYQLHLRNRNEVDGKGRTMRGVVGSEHRGFQPVVSLKRSPSKVNLDTTPTGSPDESGLKGSPFKVELAVPAPPTPRITQSEARVISCRRARSGSSPRPRSAAKSSVMPVSKIVAIRQRTRRLEKMAIVSPQTGLRMGSSTWRLQDDRHEAAIPQLSKFQGGNRPYNEADLECSIQTRSDEQVMVARQPFTPMYSRSTMPRCHDRVYYHQRLCASDHHSDRDHMRVQACIRDRQHDRWPAREEPHGREVSYHVQLDRQHAYGPDQHSIVSTPWSRSDSREGPEGSSRNADTISGMSDDIIVNIDVGAPGEESDFVRCQRVMDG
ncbi:hypothetical protein FDECE_6952 [Fusarium decemcellulare]|nr:hypothetical protein FDECE_6952 [Fusarium decemcellulare]